MIVLDCNAALAMALGSDEGRALSMLAETGEQTIAPTLFHAELAHVLAKYVKGGYFGKSQALEIGRDAAALVSSFCDDGALWPEAMSESIRLDHSSYDMLYFILARRTGSALFTLDVQLAALCAREGVDCVEKVTL